MERPLERGRSRVYHDDYFLSGPDAVSGDDWESCLGSPFGFFRESGLGLLSASGLESELVPVLVEILDFL